MSQSSFLFLLFSWNVLVSYTLRFEHNRPKHRHMDCSVSMNLYERACICVWECVRVSGSRHASVHSVHLLPAPHLHCMLARWLSTCFPNQACDDDHWITRKSVKGGPDTSLRVPLPLVKPPCVPENPREKRRKTFLQDLSPSSFSPPLKGPLLYHQVWVWLANTSHFENLPLPVF